MPFQDRVRCLPEDVVAREGPLTTLRSLSARPKADVAGRRIRGQGEGGDYASAGVLKVTQQRRSVWLTRALAMLTVLVALIFAPALIAAAAYAIASMVTPH